MGTGRNDIRYTQDHEWLRLEADGSVVVGITDHAQQQLGDLVFVQLPDVGKQFAAGDEAAVIESVKAASEIKAPLAGTVIEVNTALVGEPSTVNQDPMGAGWFIKFKLDNPAEFAALMDEAAYAKFVESQG
jgi:glycine cleavage system H protein